MSWARRQIQTSARARQSHELCLRGLSASILAAWGTHDASLARRYCSSLRRRPVRADGDSGHVPAVICDVAFVLPSRRARGNLTVFPPAWSYFVLIVASALLLQAAWTDLREFKIRNEMILVLAGPFFLYTPICRHRAVLT